jgi:predicted RNA-binding Zn-ribbon protein involved in translation (DUF1610 family)
MTGCSRAVAERDRLRAAAAQCPTLAYGLHLTRGRKCRRIGGLRQCGECAGDLLPVIFKQSMEKPGARISSEN